MKNLPAPGQKVLRVLVTVKAYPNPSKSLMEASCVAGVTEDKNLVRLYPVPFRFLAGPQKFKKFQWVEVPVVEPRNDSRKETLRPQFDSLKVVSPQLSTDGAWRERWQWVRPVLSESLCDIQDAQEASGTSLGFFKPAEILDFDWEREKQEDWTAKELAHLEIRDLFLKQDRKRMELLEKIPYSFRYRFRCADCRNAEPHHMKIVDWELMQFYRRMREESETIEDCLRKVRDKWLDELCGAEKDTHFFVGNMQAHLNSFLVLGVFWPPKVKKGPLL